MNKTKKLFSKSCATFLVMLTVFSSFTGLLSISTTKANAASVVVNVDKGALYTYDYGTYTAKLQANRYTGNDDYQVYCLNPGYMSPMGDSTSKAFGGEHVKKIEDTDVSLTVEDNIYKAVYYGYGGNGYDEVKSAFDTCHTTGYYDGGTKLGVGGYLSDYHFGYVMNHILYAYLYAGKSKTFAGNGSDLNAACFDAWYTAAEYIWNRIDAQAKIDNYNYREYAQVYVIDNHWEDTQKMLYVVNKGSLALTKKCESGYTDFVDDNPNSYSLAGAEFNLYTTYSAAESNRGSSDSHYFGKITVGSDGRGTYNNGAVIATNNRRFYAIENKAPKGYALNTNVYTLSKSSSVNSDGVPVYQITGIPDTPKMALELTKVSSDKSITENNECYSLAGAVYQVYTDERCTNNLTSDGSNVTITTDENGYGTFNNKALINAQTAYAKEIKPSPGYELDTNVYKFYNSGKTTEKGGTSYPVFSLGKSADDLTVPEQPGLDPVTILLQKRDAITGEATEGLANAEFTIKYYAGSYSSPSEVESVSPTRTWVLKTDDNGVIVFADEKYFVKEKSDERYYSIFGIPEIPYGFITMQESKAPENYQLSPDLFYAVIDESSADKNIDWHATNEIARDEDGNLLINEHPDNGGLTLRKTSSDGVNEGVWFELKTSEGEHVGNYVTGSDGYALDNAKDTDAKLSELSTGTYIVSELGFTKDSGKNFYYPKRYGNKPADKTIEVKSGETATVTFENVATPGRIVIDKTADDNKVANVYFDVTSTSGYSTRIKTNTYGQAVLNNLQVYDDNDNVISYTIKELGFADPSSESGYSIPEYYNKPSDQTVNLVDGARLVSGSYQRNVDFNNEIKKLNIVLQKYSDDSATVHPSIFYNITSTDGYNEIVEVSLDDKEDVHSGDPEVIALINGYAVKSYGIKTITDLPVIDKDGNYITYTVTELGYPDGKGGYYIPDYFTKSYLKKTITADPNAPLPIESKEGQFFDTIFAVKTNDSYNAKASFLNKYVAGKIKLTKTSYDDKISGIYFKLESDYENFSKIEKTDENGEINWKNLMVFNPITEEKIKYTVTELGELVGEDTYQIPENYAKQDALTLYIDNYDNTVNLNTYDNWLLYVATVNSRKGCLYSAETNFNNISPKGTLAIKKVSEDNDVNDYWFNVTDEDGYNYGNYSTGKSDTVKLNDLDVYNKKGEKKVYTVTELGKCLNYDELDIGVEPIYEIPIRYVEPEPVSVSINSNETAEPIVFATITNMLKKGSVNLIKTDEEGKTLEGAEFQLYKSDGSLVKLTYVDEETGYIPDVDGDVETVVTPEDGSILITKLDLGDYYFVETKAPTGMNLLKESVPFTISPTEYMDVVIKSVADVKKLPLPVTGGNGLALILFALAGLSIVIGSCSILYIKRKSR